MKEGFVLKSGSSPESGELEKINRFTRRRFSAEELYAFPVVLCDNEIDRDGERFTLGALEKLSELFLGKTGVFDHTPLAKNQTARIYDCRVERDPVRVTAAGEPYARLTAQAYLPKIESNADLITELECGIKKEVSVGCAVAKVTCSVCGADLKKDACEHVRGKSYGGTLCCAVLDEPTDAYEWSFVAVPAQKEAGVIKSFCAGETEGTLRLLKEAGGTVTLSPSQAENLFLKFSALEREARDGRDYHHTLKQEFLRCASLAYPELPGRTLTRAADTLEAEDLRRFSAEFLKQASKTAPLTPQLAPVKASSKSDGNAPFRI